MPIDTQESNATACNRKTPVFRAPIGRPGCSTSLKLNSRLTLRFIWSAAIVLPMVMCVAITVACAAPPDDLAMAFQNPPVSARPWVYWIWLNGNVTKEGITADLEAMQRVGIGGVLIMEVDMGAGNPIGLVAFASPAWRELFKHVCREANRLGLQVNMNNDAGWCGSAGPWITPELSMQKVVWTETDVEGSRQIDLKLPRPQAVADFYRDIAVLAYPTPANPFRIAQIDLKSLEYHAGGDEFSLAAWPAAPKDAIIHRDRIVDLTAHLDKDGKLAWNAPAGKWTILRLGHTTTGKTNHPSPLAGCGLECDKLSKKATETHFNALLGKLLADNRDFAGSAKALVSTHIDSWEVGSQNWTPRMREEFRRLRGYDLLPLLPVMTGRVVGSLEVSERFLWDVRQTVSTLLVENYAGHMRELAHRHGIRLSIEAYAGVPCNDMTYAGQADEPMAEFWTLGYDNRRNCVEMASAAHVYGKPILGAEAFTADDGEKWLYHPGSIKSLGDWAFCQGINRFVICCYAMQPWPGHSPGMAMGTNGLHYQRTQTWWEQSKPWHEYLARCQHLLRQGLFVADVCYLGPEGDQVFSPQPSRGESDYNFDGCPPDALLTRMSVQNGRLVLPDGMSYRLLALPPLGTMTPTLLRGIKRLVDAGATVVGPKPWKSPGLSNYPDCDAEVQKLAAELWDTGKILANATPESVLGQMGVPPDFDYTASRTLRYLHRRLADADVYFVSNGGHFDYAYNENRFAGQSGHHGYSRDRFAGHGGDESCNAVCTFRVRGAQPELWNPETGRITRLPVFEEANGCTRVPLHFEPAESVFVVFRHGHINPAEHVVSVRRDGQELLGTTAQASGDRPAIDLVRKEVWRSGAYAIKTMDGRCREFTVGALPEPLNVTEPWDVRFPPDSGAPSRITVSQLLSWSKHNDPGVRHFSGAATYRTTFHLPSGMLDQSRRLYLDLGTVKVMAEVSLNGKNLGILWKTPYRLEVTDAALTGENILEVKVVNLWVNRMIGDEQLPEDSDRSLDGAIRAWPTWLTEGKPSPTGRRAFTTWRQWKKGDSLVASGLIGPVQILTAKTMQSDF